MCDIAQSLVVLDLCSIFEARMGAFLTTVLRSFSYLRSNAFGFAWASSIVKLTHSVAGGTGDRSTDEFRTIVRPGDSDLMR